MRYRDDPEWADVVKVPQDDGPNPIASISYSASFVDVMDCFRGILLTQEMSERTLRLTSDVIRHNAANYTAWHYRRLILDYLHANLYDEMEYTQDMAINNPKNYQIWHHRREICSRLKDGSREKDFTARALEDDSKNYHAWAHRQWAITAFPALLDGEISFVEKMLTEDLRNNSAWNHRWFVLKQSNKLSIIDHPDIINREVDFALSNIDIAPHNESPWNYLRGLSNHVAREAKDTPATLAMQERIMSKCLEVYGKTADCIFAVSQLVDYYSSEQWKDIAKAKELLQKLKDEIDPIRKNYWKYREMQL